MGQDQMEHVAQSYLQRRADRVEKEGYNSHLSPEDREKVEAYNRAYWHKVYRPQEPVKMTKENLWLYAQHRFRQIYGKAFQLDEYNRPLVKMLLAYFMQEPEFESMGEDFSLEKNLLLFGDVGSGKTAIMRMFAVNPLQTYITYNCLDVEDDFTQKGIAGISDYWNDKYLPATCSNPFNHRSIGICFDDLGTEDTARHYGNQKNVMAHILQLRYNNVSGFMHKTHITTNLYGDEIQDNYGSRCASRIRQMFNQIVLPDQPDRRKKTK